MTKCRTHGGFIWTDDAERFLHDAKTLGWKQALISVQESNGPNKVAEASAPNRLAWFNLVDIHNDSRVLDIGAGSGGVACQLAKKCHVEAIDVSEVDIEFLKIRGSQDNLINLNAQVASAVSLRFSSNYFDVVSLNGVLEWIPLSEPDMRPRDVQLKALSEIKRVLKNQGKLLLGIENAKRLAYFCGTPEPHVNLKYISLMSENQANSLSMAIRKIPFLEKTYSLEEYFTLLKDAGFKNIEAFWMYPDYRLPEFIIPLSKPNAIRYCIENLIKPHAAMTQDAYSEYLFYFFNEPNITKHFFGHFCFLCN